METANPIPDLTHGQLKLRVERHHQLHVGDQIKVTIRPEFLHAFDSSDGQRISS